MARITQVDRDSVGCKCLLGPWGGGGRPTGLRPGAVSQHILSLLETSEGPGKKTVSSNLTGFFQFWDNCYFSLVTGPEQRLDHGWPFSSPRLSQLITIYRILCLQQRQSALFLRCHIQELHHTLACSAPTCNGPLSLVSHHESLALEALLFGISMLSWPPGLNLHLVSAPILALTLASWTTWASVNQN